MKKKDWDLILELCKRFKQTVQAEPDHPHSLALTLKDKGTWTIKLYHSPEEVK